MHLRMESQNVLMGMGVRKTIQRITLFNYIKNKQIKNWKKIICGADCFTQMIR